jgi:hypothetical protein
MRLRTGALPVRVDDEWVAEFPAHHRRLVTVVTWPFLRAYGYGTPAVELPPPPPARA